MFVIWLTGPSGAGKTVLARALEEKLKGLGYRVEVLDGDIVRKTLYPKLGFSREEREMHNRVVIYMAKLLSKNNVITIVSLISPFKSVREQARREIGKFIEVYLKCPLKVRVRRDPKGLYAKAMKGEIKNLTGYNGIYEEPENPEVILETHKMNLDKETEIIISKAEQLNYLKHRKKLMETFNVYLN